MIHIKKMNFILVFSLAIFAISCSKNQERSRLVIQFDSSTFNTQKKSSIIATGLINPNGPNWGASDPEDIGTDIQCFGIFVYANEEGMKESSCTSVSGNKFKFGPRAGFFPLNGEGAIFVPSGEKRKIILIGMASLDGSCDRGFAINPDIRFSNYSHPFVIGQAEANLRSGINRVEINLVNSFSESNKIQTCDFLKDDGEGDSFNPQELNISFYESKRTIWVRENPVPRKVNLIYDSSQVLKKECSNDNATTFSEANCGADPFSYTWEVDDYEYQHSIRLTYLDGSTSTKEFTPSTQYPGLEFVTCDYTFSGAGGPADTFQDSLSSITFSGAVGTANKVICLSGGVNITAPTAIPKTINNIANDVTIVAQQGDWATLSNANLSKGTISLSSKTGIRFVGINITCAGQGGSPAAISLSDSNNIEFQDVLIDEEGSQGPDRMIKLSGTSSTPGIRLLSTIINAYDKGIYVDGTNHLEIEIKDSHIQGDTCIFTDGSGAPSVSIVNSTLKNKGTHISKRLISLNTPTYPLNFSITDSELIDNSGGGIFLNGSNITFEMSGNIFKRTELATAGNNEPVIKTISNPTINSANDGNSFCHEDATNAAINLSIFSGTPYLTGFNLSAQVNGGVPTICPN